MKTYLVRFNVTPRVVMRAKQRAKDCMSRTRNPEECRADFELVDELQKMMVVVTKTPKPTDDVYTDQRDWWEK